MPNKTDLVNDLMSTITVMEILWGYHPENKDKIDIVEYYAQLQVIKDDIEIELGELGS